MQLFQAANMTLAGGSPQSCCKIMCVCVDPYQNSKNQVTTLIAMGLDDAKIVCQYHIQVGMSESYILVVMNLNDFWSSNGDSCHDMHRSIDLEKRVLKMINIEDEVQNNLGHLDRVDNYI